MARYAKYCFMKRLYAVFALVLLTLATSLAARASGGQDDRKPSQVTEGCLLYRSPISDRFDPVPLIHTDVVLDVRGLVASATVTQQYANSSTEPIEAVYIFPLPHDAAPQSGSRSPEKTGGCYGRLPPELLRAPLASRRPCPRTAFRHDQKPQYRQTSRNGCPNQSRAVSSQAKM